MELLDWVNQTKASEIMVEDVLTLSPDDSLAMAAEKLLREQISGAPVVDDSGRCLGVLAMHDLIGSEEGPAEHQQTKASAFFDFGMSLPLVDAKRLEQLCDKDFEESKLPVGRCMTTSLVSVRSDAPLATVVSYIIDAHVHRVLVLDEDQCLKGIISTIDILAALQRASR